MITIKDILNEKEILDEELMDWAKSKLAGGVAKITTKFSNSAMGKEQVRKTVEFWMKSWATQSASSGFNNQNPPTYNIFYNWIQEKYKTYNLKLIDDNNQINPKFSEAYLNLIKVYTNGPTTPPDPIDKINNGQIRNLLSIIVSYAAQVKIGNQNNKEQDNVKQPNKLLNTWLKEAPKAGIDPRKYNPKYIPTLLGFIKQELRLDDDIILQTNKKIVKMLNIPIITDEIYNNYFNEFTKESNKSLLGSVKPAKKIIDKKEINEILLNVLKSIDNLSKELKKINPKTKAQALYNAEIENGIINVKPLLPKSKTINNIVKEIDIEIFNLNDGFQKDNINPEDIENLKANINMLMKKVSI